MRTNTGTDGTRLLATALLVVLVVLAGCGGQSGSEAPTGGTGGGGGGAGSSEAGAGGGGSGDATGSYYQNGTRVVVRSADMRLQVSDHDPAFAEARRIARRQGGFVADYEHEIDRGWDRTTMVVRVPAGNFTPTRDALADLGTLEREQVDTKDLTVRVADTEERLEDLRTEERNLERLLNQTNDAGEARRVREDLRQVRDRIRSLSSELRSVRTREALSTIRLTIHEPPSEKPPKNYETAFGFDDAFLEAFYGGLGAVKFVIVAFGYLIPAGVALLAVFSFAFAVYRVGRLVYARLDAVLPGPAADDEE